MKQLFKILVSFSILFLLIGCTPFDETNKGDISSEKNFIYNIMKTNYYWNDTLPSYSNEQIEAFNNSQSLLNDLRYSLDRWSYIETISNYENRSEQIDSGFGCYFYVNNADEVFILEVDFDSPCDKDGLERGDKILKIGEFDIDQISNADYNNYSSNEGVSTNFEIERNNTNLTIAVTPKVYQYKTVKFQIIEQNTTKIGHLIYEGFTASSYSEYDKAFDTFKENNVTEIILDLRYNGGGSLAVASALLDKFAGNIDEFSIQFYQIFNANNSKSNSFAYFSKDENSIALDRVFILTTSSSASASELVINALKPYMEVITIGETTHGKPVGMRGYRYQNKIFWPVSFSLQNVNRVGDYFNGIEPTCEAEDNISLSRTDVNEDMLSKALFYIGKDSCD